jgi:DNA helicase-2/ATP-dependent DNA helicase PcrA
MVDIFEQLNEKQAEAVKHIDGAMLILAGAGSGKTKTITSRVAYLISLGIDPSNILTLTFTNKAANEMRNRALSLVSNNAIYPPLLCTFHKFGLLFLKFYIEKLGRKNNFVIIDTDDKKRIIKSLNDTISSSLIASEISRCKNSLISPQDAMKSATNNNYREIYATFAKYQQNLLENNLVDFDDLLVLPYEILLNNEELANEISDKYQYIMVDEYQDTNEIQYRLLKMLCKNHQNLCVVGDDDQSIYGWRGANIDNILNFKDEFDDVKIVKLEHNYRSTKKILDTANTLIEYNSSRLGKELKSTKGEGESVELKTFFDEKTEARELARDIAKLLDSGVDASEIAVLFRVNAISRSLEEGLNRENIPYQLIGGVRFYERAEIKDLISYFRVFINGDDFSIKRIINKPKRGLGAKTVEKLINGATESKKLIFDYINDISIEELQTIVSKKNSTTIKDFVSKVLECRDYLKTPMQFLDKFEEIFEFRKSYIDLPDGTDRVANIDELYGHYRDYIKSHPDYELEDYLNELSLESDQDKITEDTISMMSIHASKGLEFEHLFIVGLEEGFFPLNGDGVDIEEERRLGYVAITRAKKSLTISTVGSRFYKGKRTALSKSRFLKEANLIKKTSFNPSVSTGVKSTPNKSGEYSKGDLVKHKVFGIGRVEDISKDSAGTKLTINFGGHKRTILSSFVESAV